MTREEQIDWLCRLRADLNNGVIYTPWNKEFTEALTDVIDDNEQHFEALDISKGEWRPIYQGDEIIDYRCNKCEFGSTFGRGKYRFNYCPNCGARMKAGE